MLIARAIAFLLTVGAVVRAQAPRTPRQDQFASVVSFVFDQRSGSNTPLTRRGD